MGGLNRKNLKKRIILIFYKSYLKEGMIFVINVKLIIIDPTFNLIF